MDDNPIGTAYFGNGQGTGTVDVTLPTLMGQAASQNHELSAQIKDYCDPEDSSVTAVRIDAVRVQG